MLLGQYPGLEWKARRVGGKSEKIPVFSDYADACFSFLADDIAEDTALLVDVILLRTFELFSHINGKNRKRNKLRMAVPERGTGGSSVILENLNVLETTIFLEVENTVTESPEDIFNAFGGEIPQASVVVRSFDND